MKIYTCVKSFKTTLFKENKEVERISIDKGTDWFLAKRESNNRVVMCNNKMELIIANEILEKNFELIIQ